MTSNAPADERFREALERLLSSPEFSSSRQIQDFLRYTSERAFDGALQVDQAEIAAAVLGRGESFNPVEDASVRKVASATRQRLERYYAGPGRSDVVIVTLPVRSYVPRYEYRPLVPDNSAPIAGEPPRHRLWIAAALAALLLVLLSVWLWPRLKTNESETTFEIVTQRGDISSPGSDAGAGSVQLGPYLRDQDDVFAIVEFAPAQENQQAGILIWQDEDNFIQLGRRFLGRNQVALIVEEDGHVSNSGNWVRYDPDGQAGKAIWLILRRNGNRYRGLISLDGAHWEDLGPEFSPAKAFAKPRLGIYALNGRRDAPAIVAKFQNLSTGANFVALPDDPASTLKALGWHVNISCSNSFSSGFGPLGMEIGLGTVTTGCNAEWSIPVERGNWEYVTKLDFFTLPDLSAGLNLRGSRGHAIRIVRYELNGPSLCFIHDGKLLVGIPDLNGSPSVYLKLRNRAGVVTGSYSVDGRRFHELPGRAQLRDMGAAPEIGLRVSSRRMGEVEGKSVASFAFLHRTVPSLKNYR